MTAIDLVKICNEYLSYNPHTGIFIWKKRKGQNTKVGKAAGGKTGHGYQAIMLEGSTYKAHRLAFLLCHGWLPCGIDHINGVRDDNRIINLRECTPKQNGANRGVNKNNTSGYKGVTFDNGHKRWRARLGTGGVEYYLGLYDCKIEAAKAYNVKALEMFGEFAWLNKV